MTNGTCQGSVLSPILFNVYINDLIFKLMKSEAVIRVNGRFTGGIAYADDLSAISAARGSMQTLLQICDSFARRNYLKFNHHKSKVIVFK